MIHQGSILKKLIKKGDLPIGDFVSKAGFSRQYLYLLYGKETLDDRIINLACELLNVNKSVFTSGDTNNNSDLEALKLKIEMLEDKLRDKDELLKSKEELIELLRSQNKGSDYSGKRKVS